MTVIKTFSKTEEQPSFQLFRRAFGILMCLANLRFMEKGWVRELYLVPKHHFSYFGLDFISPLSGGGMYILYGIMAVCALAIALTRSYRIFALLFCLLFSWVELMDKTLYLNHYYLVSLLSFWLFVLPPGKKGSLWILRGQIAIVYISAGLAKIHWDWLAQALPLRLWLPGKSDLPIAGPLLEMPVTAYIMSWAGMLYDISIVLLLSFKKTRKPGILLVLSFHLATWVLFPIGMFPWIMILSSTVFLDKNWPRQLAYGIKSFLIKDLKKAVPKTKNHKLGCPGFKRENIIWAFCLCLLAVQAALPFRSFLYKGDVRWHERGFRFAWKVMLVEKTGTVEYLVSFRDGASRRICPDEFLTPLQSKMLSFAPDMIVQAAVMLQKELETQNRFVTSVRADVWVSLNGKPSQRLLNPEVNLLKPLPQNWILPYENKNAL